MNRSSSAEGRSRQFCTDEKKVEVTSQMKDTRGSMLPASDRLLVSDNVACRFSKIFSKYAAPIRGSSVRKK